MRFDPQRHHRHALRLPGYDYSQAGAYFVTLCTHNRECLFGEIANGQMRLNEAGRLVQDCWTWLAQQYPYVELDAWVIMPNHLHGVLVIRECRGGSRTAPTEDRHKPLIERGPLPSAPTAPTARKPLGRLIGAFRTVSTPRINALRGAPVLPVWQRNYYEHIIRDEEGLQRIREYIAHNPARWETDRENPAVVSQARLRTMGDRAAFKQTQ